MSPISIIIVNYDETGVLSQTLNGILAQGDEQEMEVVVVDERKEGDAYDLVEPLAATHSNLRSTFIPGKPQYITDLEVAIMLGVKAARYDSIVILPPSFSTESATWRADVDDIIRDETVLFGAAHNDGKNMFPWTGANRKKKKLIKRWCKEQGLRASDLILRKDNRSLFSIAFQRKAYLSDAQLRHVISSYISTEN